MKIKYAIGLLIISVVMMFSGCSTGNYPEPERPVDVNRTYEKVDPSPAAVADSYDLSLKLDTENDRLTEKVSMDIQNNTDSQVDTVYLRYNPMGYFDYLCEAKPEAADKNKDKKAEITSIKFAGSEKELTAEYEAYNQFKKLNGADWKNFNYKTLAFENRFPKNKKLTLKFNDDAGNISFNWGYALLSGDAAKKGNLDVNLALASIYLCEGIYHGQNEIESRMEDLYLYDPVSEYHQSDWRSYKSPITVASNTVLMGGQRYLIVGVAIREVHRLVTWVTY